jgi:sulfur carrier protein
MPEAVSVQLNGNFVKRENFSTTHLKENDEVEFLYFMGGGTQ